MLVVVSTFGASKLTSGESLPLVQFAELPTFRHFDENAWWLRLASLNGIMQPLKSNWPLQQHEERSVEI